MINVSCLSQRLPGGAGLGLGFAEGQDLEYRYSRWGEPLSCGVEANLVGRSVTGLNREWAAILRFRLNYLWTVSFQNHRKFSLIQSALSKRICGLQSCHFCLYSPENLWEWSVLTFRVTISLSLRHSEERSAEAYPGSPSDHSQAHRGHAQDAFCWATADIRYWATWGRNWKWAKYLRWVWFFIWKGVGGQAASLSSVLYSNHNVENEALLFKLVHFMHLLDRPEAVTVCQGFHYKFKKKVPSCFLSVAAQTECGDTAGKILAHFILVMDSAIETVSWYDSS